MARYFDRPDPDYISVADHAALTTPSGSWTIAGWILTREAASPPAGDWLYFLSWGTWNAVNSINLIYQHSTGNVRIGIRGASGSMFDVTSTNALTRDAWDHVAVTFTGTSLNTYINGTLGATIGASGLGAVNSATALILGGHTGLEANYFIPGEMAEWAKWDSALDAEQRTALFAGVRPTEVGTRPAWYMPMLAGLEEEIAGLVLTNSGTTISEHPPKIICPGIPHVLWAAWPTIDGPYQVSAAATAASGAADGQVFSTGTLIGQVNEQ